MWRYTLERGQVFNIRLLNLSLGLALEVYNHTFHPQKTSNPPLWLQNVSFMWKSIVCGQLQACTLECALKSDNDGDNGKRITVLSQIIKCNHLCQRDIWGWQPFHNKLNSRNILGSYFQGEGRIVRHSSISYLLLNKYSSSAL